MAKSKNYLAETDANFLADALYEAARMSFGLDRAVRNAFVRVVLILADHALALALDPFDADAWKDSELRSNALKVQREAIAALKRRNAEAAKRYREVKAADRDRLYGATGRTDEDRIFYHALNIIPKTRWSEMMPVLRAVASLDAWKAGVREACTILRAPVEERAAVGVSLGGFERGPLAHFLLNDDAGFCTLVASARKDLRKDREESSESESGEESESVSNLTPEEAAEASALAHLAALSEHIASLSGDRADIWRGKLADAFGAFLNPAPVAPEVVEAHKSQKSRKRTARKLAVVK